MFAINTNGSAQTSRKAREAGHGGEMRSASGHQAAGFSFSADPIGYVTSFLKRYFIVLGVLGLTGLLIGAALGFLTPNRYASTTQLLIDPRDLRVLQNEISPQSMGGDATAAYLESQARIIASDSIKRKVIEKLALDRDPDFGRPGGGIGTRFGLTQSPGVNTRDPVLVALAAMDKQVIVRRGERTFVIDITAITGDGTKSAAVANAMAETYLEDQTSVRSETAQRTSQSLSSRLNELRERVRIAEDKVEKYRAANNLVGASGKLVSDEQLAVSNTQLAQARARTADAQAKFDQVRAVRPSSIESGATPEALNSPSIAAFRAQLGSALTREADALVLYGAQHPILVSAQAQVRDARRQIAEEVQRTVQATRAELDRARAAETAISAQVDRLKRESLATSQATVQLRELERDADASRQVYQAFLLRARETGEQSGVDSTNARVITAAVAPLDKLGPNRKVFAAIGLIAGLAAGVAFGLLRDLPLGRRQANPVTKPDMNDFRQDPQTRERDEAESARNPASGPTEPPPGSLKSAARPTDEAKASGPRSRDAANGLAAARGIVPFALRAKEAGVTASATATEGKASRWRGFANTAPASVAEPEADIGPLQVVLPAPRTNIGWRPQGKPMSSAFHGTGFATDGWDSPKSPLALAVTDVRDRLALEEKLGSNRTVVVFGLAPGAGTSLVALNLVLATAREKTTPILIDLAGGPASLSASFAADAEIGAEDVISGAAGLIRAALQDDETGTFFLPRPAGAQRRATPCPARLRSNLIEQTRRFDMVVIDAGSTADGALPYQLAELADDIVVTVPVGTSKDAATRLMQRSLGADAEKVRVVVYNQASKA